MTRYEEYKNKSEVRRGFKGDIIALVFKIGLWFIAIIILLLAIFKW